MTRLTQVCYISISELLYPLTASPPVFTPLSEYDYVAGKNKLYQHCLETDKRSFRPVHHLLIYTDTHFSRFFGLLILPKQIPISKFEYHTDTDFMENTNTLIMIPIKGLALCNCPLNIK